MPVLAYDSAVAKHLRSGEQLLWVGRPVQGYIYRWRNRVVIVQVTLALLVLGWAAKWGYWAIESLAQHTTVNWLPARFYFLLAVCAGMIYWHLITERNRRAGTWYAVTDRRILFILTTENPQSVFSTTFDEIARIELCPVAPWSSAVIVSVKLKQIDPYMGSVLGYQMSAKSVDIEDLENPREFFQQVVRAKAALLPVNLENLGN
jgi:hypothetical protein